MAHPPLTKTQHDVLRTVRYEPRTDRWNHITLSYLRALGLVTSESASAKAGLLRWTVTDLGKAVYAAPRGTPVSGALLESYKAALEKA